MVILFNSKDFNDTPCALFLAPFLSLLLTFFFIAADLSFRILVFFEQDSKKSWFDNMSISCLRIWQVSKLSFFAYKSLDNSNVQKTYFGQFIFEKVAPQSSKRGSTQGDFFHFFLGWIFRKLAWIFFWCVQSPILWKMAHCAQLYTPFSNAVWVLK